MTPLRQPDPTKVGWDMMAAFGSDDDGNTFLQCVLEYCCDPIPAIEIVKDAVACARTAFHAAPKGVQATLCMMEALRQAGMVPMDAGAADNLSSSDAPRAMFYAPRMGKVFTITHRWGIRAAEI